MRLRSTFLALVGLAQLACSEQLQLVDRRTTGGISTASFWPPPASTDTWELDPSPGATLDEVASKLEQSLRGAGYTEQRWFPIGTEASHGFAVTTRLERLPESPTPRAFERWSSMYVDAANLRWLELAHTTPLPRPGHYRVLLLSYTDLPVTPSDIAPSWNEHTLMDWPSAPERRSAADCRLARRKTPHYRFGIFEYEYEYDELERRGQRVDAAAIVDQRAVTDALGFVP